MKTFITLFVYLAFLCGNALAQDAPLILKFGLFADAQYADCPSENTRFYRETLRKMDTCVSYFNRQNVEFTINLGDIVDRKNSDLKQSCLVSLVWIVRFIILRVIMIIKRWQMSLFYTGS